MAVVVRWYQEEVEDNLHKSLFLAEEATAQRYFEIVTSEDDELDSKIDKQSPSRNESIKDLSDISEHTITIRVEFSGGVSVPVFEFGEVGSVSRKGGVSVSVFEFGEGDDNKINLIGTNMLKWPRGIGINLNDRRIALEWREDILARKLAREAWVKAKVERRRKSVERRMVEIDEWRGVRNLYSQVRKAYARQAAVYGDVYARASERAAERTLLIRWLGLPEVKARESSRREWARTAENVLLRQWFTDRFGSQYSENLIERYLFAGRRPQPGSCVKCGKYNPVGNIYPQGEGYLQEPIYRCPRCITIYGEDTSVRDEEAIERIAKTDRQQFLKTQERLYDILESQKYIRESETYWQLRLQQRRIRVMQDIRHGDWYKGPESTYIPEGSARCYGCGIAIPVDHTGTQQYCFDCQQIERDNRGKLKLPPFLQFNPLPQDWAPFPGPPIIPDPPPVYQNPSDSRVWWFDHALISPESERGGLVANRTVMLDVLKNNLDELKQVFIATLELSS